LWLSIATAALLALPPGMAKAQDRPPSADAAVVWVHVIPTGYERGRFTALVQIVVPGSPLPRRSWDLDATLVPHGEPAQRFAGRVEVTAPGVPLVLEKAVLIPAGPCEVRAEARNVATGESASRRVELDWPDPDAAPASVGPVAVLQEAAGAFVREGVARNSGSLGRARSEPLRSDVRSALLAIVCGSVEAGGSLHVARRLLGRETLQFPDVEVDVGTSRCAVLQDLIPAGTLDAGFYRYEVTVSGGGQPLARGYRTFSSAKPGG
jgi:hypothetical protein